MASSKKSGTSLGIETLEGRCMPAYISGGNLIIVGTDAADNVFVQPVTVNGVAQIRVNQNGAYKDFPVSQMAVDGQIKFWGYGGDDTFDTIVPNRRVYAVGGEGNDTLHGGPKNDTLFGELGNDKLYGWGGNDDVIGGPEVAVPGKSDNDTLGGGSGDDRLWGGYGDDLLGGGAGDDQIMAGAGGDIAFGGTGSDQFWGLNNDISTPFLIPMQTEFGTAYTLGVQDYTYVPPLHIIYEPEQDRIWT